MADDWNEDSEVTGKNFATNSNNGWYGGGDNFADDNTKNGFHDNDEYNDRPRRGGDRGGRGRGGKFSNFGDRGYGDNNNYREKKRFGEDNGEDFQDNNDDGFDKPRRGGGRGGGASRGGRDGGGGNRDGKVNGEEKPRELYIPPEPTDDESQIFSSGITSGINFSKYDNIPVKVTGENAPAAINSFEESGLKQFVLDNVKKSGYIKPTPIQKTAIPIIMGKRDLMGCAQTGSGKTASYLLPIIHELLTQKSELTIGKPQALIVSPTRELSIQIYEEARKFSLGSYLKISIVYGGTAVKHQGDNINKGCHILVATTGRLLDFMDRGFVSLEDTKFIVLDEADRMLDMGFLPNIEKIMSHPTISPQNERQNLMFSATFPVDIQKLAGQFLNNYIFLAIGIVGGACADVDQNFYEVSKFAKRTKLTEVLKENDAAGTIVFVDTKRSADFLASLMSETQYPTTSIHGDRLQREREEALRDFKSGKMSVLIATSVASRGLDIKNVAHVINYDMPKSIDEYVHRIGRTGRVGNRGKATSFFDPDQDSAIASDLIKILEQAEKEVPEFLRNCGGAGGGGSYSRRQFGGKDFRSNDYSTEPEPQEPEEVW